MMRAALLDEFARRILAIDLPHPVRVAVDGIDASGKTTLAAELAEKIRSLNPPRPVIQASIDRFHHSRAVRYRLGPDSPEGYYADSFDLTALRHHLLEPLGPAGSRFIRTQLFDFRSDSFVTDETAVAATNAILLFDGVFLQRPELAGLWDFVIFVQVDFETALTRAIERDAALLGSRQSVIARYHKRYLPAQRMYLERCHPLANADVIVINDDPFNPALHQNLK